VRGVDYCRHAAGALTKIVATGDTPEVFNGYCGAESGSVPVAAASPAILTSELEVQEKREFDGPAADSAAARARCNQDRRHAVRRAERIAGLILLLAAMGPAAAAGAQTPRIRPHAAKPCAMRVARAKTRLELKIPNIDQPVRPYYVEYRLLDLEVREVVAEFGTLFSSTHTRNRFMDVEARVGSYKLDSSNFVSDDGFPRLHRTDRLRGNRSRLRFAEAGLVDRDRSGLQRSGGRLIRGKQAY